MRFIKECVLGFVYGLAMVFIIFVLAEIAFSMVVGA